MKEIDYVCPATLEEAVAVLAENGPAARPLCGGTDVIVQVREGRRDPDLLVDVKRIPQLNQLSFDAETGLVLGAAVPCCDIAAAAGLQAAYPGLIDAVSLIGGTQIQSRASVGGNLCNASPAADTIPALIALGAVCDIVGPEATRQIPVHEFCTAPGQNALRPGEMLVSLRIPPPSLQGSSAYLRFIPRNEMDIAVVGVGVSIVVDEPGENLVAGRIGLAAVGPTPLFAEQASERVRGAITAETIASVAEAAQAAARPISDMRGTAAQRRHLVAVLTRRALNKAIERATGTNPAESEG